jgi:hypothetical protein
MDLNEEVIVLNPCDITVEHALNTCYFIEDIEKN